MTPKPKIEVQIEARVATTQYSYKHCTMKVSIPKEELTGYREAMQADVDEWEAYTQAHLVVTETDAAKAAKAEEAKAQDEEAAEERASAVQEMIRRAAEEDDDGPDEP